MSNNDDLDALVSLTRKRGQASRAQPPAAPKPAKAPGLSPLDVLSLPPAQRDLVNWLARRKHARFREIQQGLSWDAGQVEQTLTALQQAGYVHPISLEGNVFYSVIFSGTVSRAGRGLGQEIWNLIDLDSVSFLDQTSLFHGLPRPVLQAIAAKVEERHYDRNQVILWQGDLAQHLYLLKRGLVEITRLCLNGRSEKLNYMKPGDAIGEVSVITGNTCSATATAISQADLLLIKRQDLNDLLAEHSSVAVQLTHILAQRLSSTTARLSSRTVETHLCVLVPACRGAGCTTLGSAMALALAQMSQGQTVYTEYPTPCPLPALLSLAQETGVYHHPGGYDSLIPRDEQEWPPQVRPMLILEHLRDRYANVIVGLPEGVGDKSSYWLEQADQVILVTPPDQASGTTLLELTARLKTMLHPDRSSLFTVVNHTRPADERALAAGPADFDIPYLTSLPSPAEQQLDSLPKPLAQTAQTLADRLGRTYQIGIYVPTTVGVDRCADTQACLEKTLAFMGQLFGGATSNQAQGVWGSQSAALVSETIYIVRSYVTQSDLDRHLPAVIEYVESLKQELKQEAMAIEVNQKLMLI